MLKLQYFDVKELIHWNDPDAGKELIHWNNPGAGKERRQEEEMTEDETVGWHHRLNGYEFEQTPADGGLQGSVWHAAVHGVTKSRT